MKTGKLAIWIGLGALASLTPIHTAAAQRPGETISLRSIDQAIDGDTFKARLGDHDIRIRLFGIDAHEFDQQCGGVPCGAMATAHLVRLLSGSVQPCPSEKMHGACLLSSRSVECRIRAVDKWQRAVAVCTSNGLDLAGSMVRDGFAYATDQGYQALFDDARLARRGLHSRGAMTLEYLPKAYRDRPR